VPRHPQLALGPAGAITIAWDEQLKGARRIVVVKGTSDDSNSVRFVRQSVSDEPGTYPVVASMAEAAIVAWTSGTTGNTVLRVERHPIVK
jgi:acyl-coenzyme A synthetase/AMP-(fatty) acid ligase